MIFNTECCISQAQPLDLTLLTRIRKCISQNNIVDTEYEKITNLLYEQELVKTKDEDIKINFGGYQANNMGSLHTPRPYINKYEVPKCDVEMNDGIRRKIRLTKWKSNKIMEYDIDTKKWFLTDTHIQPDVKRFSYTVFFPNQQMVVLGGVDPEESESEKFTSKVYSLYEVGDNKINKMYFSDQLLGMITPRGCFTAVCFDEMILVMGGINTTERVLNKCEMYVKANNTWNPMPPLNSARNNASSVKLNNDSIYCFGGCDESGTLDSIEKFSFNLNEWSILKIKLPDPVSLSSVFKISEKEILIIGGLINEHTEKSTPYKSNQVLIFDAMEPNFTYCPTTLN